MLISGEGLLSILLPGFIGTWSDSTRTALGSRMPFILAGGLLSITGLLLLPVNTASLAMTGIGLTIFFIGYFIYYSPYYALFPDLVPDSQSGRSQGAQGMFRSIGMLLSIAAGGLLLHLWTPLPFLVGAAAITCVTAVLFLSIRKRTGQSADPTPSTHKDWGAEWEMVRYNGDIRRWTIANSLWEAGLGVLRVFVVLYFTKGLGMSLPEVSGALALVGLVAVVAAPLSGKLADRYGHRPVMATSVWVFGLGLLIPLFTVDKVFVAGIIPVSCAAVVLLTLPYSVLMRLLPAHQHGVGAGLFGFSRGLGIVAGPALAGLAVTWAKPVELLTLNDTEGYSAMFGVASLLLLASIPVLNRITMTTEIR